MRHRIYGNKLGRNKDQRTALFKSLVQSLLSYGTIETSKIKAKSIKGLVDKVINFAKEKRTQHLLQSFISDKSLRDRLIKEIVPKLSSRNSGYTSLIKLGSRLGDQTMLVRMSLIGAEELKPIKVESRVKSQESSKKTITTKIKQVKKVQKIKKPVKKPTKGDNKSLTLDSSD